ncbi:MAG: hypothetical protein PUB18_06030 [bacterium]|nr:hypothetical protein [bacterium]
MEVIICGVIILGVLLYNNTIDAKKFFTDNEAAFTLLKEDDYDFLVAAKYGDQVNPNELFNQRLKMGFIAIVVFLFIFLGEFNILNIIFAIVIGYFVFKANYTSLKKFYKRHLHDIDVMLPYYLKSLEILVQHYTVPVAISKSIEEAPAIFKPGLRDLIAKIDAGDFSIQPYMDFANEYPVRDSMRMMRLLYRLGLGSQERKQERLLMFSRTVSNLQAKARETKYKERLHYMESQTMTMLVATGVGVMILILFSMIYMFSNI